MHILYASERPPFPFFLGGAARAAHMLLVRIAAQAPHTCSAIGARNYAVTPWRFPDPGEHAALGVCALDEAAGTVDCGYPVRLVPEFHAQLRGLLANARPDIVWTQLEGSLDILRTADALGLIGLCYVHDAEFAPDEMRAIAALNTHLIASSGFLADKVQAATGRRPAVIYPPAELYFDITGDPAGDVTMVNPHAVKGLDTLLAIAGRLPDVRFLLQESWKLDSRARENLDERLAVLPNVTFAPRVSDMREVYRRTRLLIAPSRWEEGFGMVALEAASCGIPVIASRRGGLPEAVGDGGVLIDDYTNVDCWVDVLTQVLSSPARCAEIGARARRHAASERFQPDALARQLLMVLSAPPQRPGALSRGLFELGRHARRWPLVGRLLSPAR